MTNVDKQLFKDISDILIKYSPPAIFLPGGINDANFSALNEQIGLGTYGVYKYEARQIAKRLSVINDLEQMHDTVYLIFVNSLEYVIPLEEVIAELDLQIIRSDEILREHAHPGSAGKKEDYLAIAEDMLNLKERYYNE